MFCYLIAGVLIMSVLIVCLHRVHDGFLVQLGANITPRALRRRVTRAAAPRADLGHGAVAHSTDRRALPKADG